MAETLSTLQRFALARETEAVVRLSQQGISALRRLDAANDFYHLPMQLLAQGFERFLKLTLALARLKTYGSLPTSEELRKAYGHNVLALTDAVIAIVEQQRDYKCRPAVQEDLEFLRNDQLLRRMLSALSIFGKWSRYYRLAEFLDPEAVSPDEDPDRAWEAIESIILRRHPDWLRQLMPSQTGDVFETVAREITAVLDRFGRAIARMWTLGALDVEASRHLGVIQAFLFLRDEDLGQP